jgi:tetratricopeptide (TPR) repeat protein
MRTTSESSSPQGAGQRTRYWLLVGFLGLLVVLGANPVRDAWSLNRAGVLVNRVVVAEATGRLAKTGSAAVAEADDVKASLAEAEALLEAAAGRGPFTVQRQTHIWRTYGAAAALAPSDEAFSLLLRASDSGWLDRIGELWLGEVASTTGHWDAANEAYRRVDASNILISQGDAYLKSGEKDLAVRAYKLARVSLDAAMQRDTAESLLSAGGNDDRSLTSTLMTSTAERVTALYRIGKGLLVAGEAEASRPLLEEAFARAQDASPGAVIEQSLRLNLAQALARTLPERPASFATRQVAYYPDQVQMTYVTAVTRIRGLVYNSVDSDRTAAVCLQAARTLLLIGDDQMAVALLKQALDLDPLMSDAYLLLGSWYEGKGMKLLPLRLYSQALEQLPKDVRIRVAHALAMYHARSLLEALPILQETAQTTTDDPYLFVALGECYLRLGMAEHARAAYLEGLRRSPFAEPLVARLEELDRAVEAFR